MKAVHWTEVKIKKQVQTEMVMLLTPVVLDAGRTADWTAAASASIEAKF